MRAILIDPFTRTISEVDYNGTGDIYTMIGCEIFTAVTINEYGDGLLVDDEGMFNPDQAFFKHKDYPEPLAGKALVLGSDEEGDTVEPAVSLQETIRSVKWVGNYELMKEVLK
jgi:hypothetical protein